MAPRTALGLTVDFGVYLPLPSLPFEGASFLAGLRWDPPATEYIPESTKGAWVSTSRFMLSVAAPCINWRNLYGCSVIDIGYLWGKTGNAAGQEQESSQNLALAGGRFGVAVPLASHLGFRLSGEILAPLTSNTITFNDSPAWTIPPISGGFEAGFYYIYTGP